MVGSEASEPADNRPALEVAVTTLTGPQIEAAAEAAVTEAIDEIQTRKEVRDCLQRVEARLEGLEQALTVAVGLLETIAAGMVTAAEASEIAAAEAAAAAGMEQKSPEAEANSRQPPMFL